MAATKNKCVSKLRGSVIGMKKDSTQQDSSDHHIFPKFRKDLSPSSSSVAF